MKKLFLATKNKDKIREISHILGFLNIELLTPYDFKEYQSFEPVENGETLEENAFIKAFEWFKRVKIPCIADDTGLFVPALNGEPGIKSARYAGENATYKENRMLLLEKIRTVKDKRSYFETVVCYFDGENKIFERGRLYGTIIEKEIGDKGFGYDSIFFVDKLNKTLAQISKEEKNAISHRGMAFLNLREKLKNIILQNSR